MKFLKEFCTKKKKIPENKKVSVRENIFVVIQKKLPPKCNDRSIFAISCIIGNVGIKKAMRDLEASINFMHLSIYNLVNDELVKK